MTFWHASGLLLFALKNASINAYQPLSISEAVWRPEPGLLGALFLELDENAWKRKMSGNRLKICN